MLKFFHLFAIFFLFHGFNTQTSKFRKVLINLSFILTLFKKKSATKNNQREFVTRQIRTFKMDI
jgi:hypothetical protein